MNNTELEALVAKLDELGRQCRCSMLRAVARMGDEVVDIAKEFQAALAKQPEQGGVSEAGMRAALDYARVNQFGLMASHVEEIARVAVQAALAARGQEGWNVAAVSRDFRFNADHQYHVPTVTVEFEPVPVGAPNDAKGWRDRDALFVHLAAAPSPESAGGGCG